MTCSIHGCASFHDLVDGTCHNHHMMSKGATEKEDFKNFMEPMAFDKSKESHVVKDPGWHVNVEGESLAVPPVDRDTMGGNLGLLATNVKGESTGSVPDGNREVTLGDAVPEL